MAVTIELPEHQLKALEPYRDRLGEMLLTGLSRMRLADALRMYESREISLGRAIEIAGVTRQEFVREARAAGLKPTSDPQAAAEELA